MSGTNVKILSSKLFKKSDLTTSYDKLLNSTKELYWKQNNCFGKLDLAPACRTVYMPGTTKSGIVVISDAMETELAGSRSFMALTPFFRLKEVFYMTGICLPNIFILRSSNFLKNTIS